MTPTPTSKLKIWAGQIRAPFLFLSVFLVLIGAAAARADGHFRGLHLALCVLGVTLAHVAVNLFNEISDHKTGIDDHTDPTPFSGGSKTLQRGLLRPRQVAAAAWIALFAALAAGIYLAWATGWLLIVFAVAGGLAALFYTSHLSRWMIGEAAAGLTLGSLVVLGTYYAQAGNLTPQVILLSIPPGILTALLLLLNEFPDAEADRLGGRRHLVIALGYRRAAILYGFGILAVYGVLGIGVALGWFPKSLLLAFLTLPLGIKAAAHAIHGGHDRDAILPALSANVAMVLGTDLLIAVAYVLHRTFA